MKVENLINVDKREGYSEKPLEHLPVSISQERLAQQSLEREHH